MIAKIVILVSILITFSTHAVDATVDDYLNYSVPKEAVIREVPFKPYGELRSAKRASVGGNIVAEWIYYRNGQVYEETLFKDGVQHGVQKTWYQSGEKMSEGPYRNGLQHGLFRHFAKDGKLLGEFEMKNGNGVMKEWNDDEKWVSECEYKDGLKDGLSKDYFPEGPLFETSTYKKGKLEGPAICYFKNGKIRETSCFKNGEMHGVVKKWLENGELDKDSPIYRINGKQVLQEEYLDYVKKNGESNCDK